MLFSSSLLLFLFVVKANSFSRSEFDLPIARIQAIEGAKLVPWTKIDDTTKETIALGVEGLRLECVANYPVQWIYTGNGIPAYTSTNKYNRRNAHGETSSEYLATVVINPIKEHHTGKYQCSPAEFIDGRTFFYVFVPGQSLFTALTGHNIVIPKNDSTITIPCTVSNPNAAVTLDKMENGQLRKLKVRSYDAVAYDAKTGFRVRTDRIEDPEGTFVCTAKYGTALRSLQYRVSRNDYSASYSYLSEQSDQPQQLNRCKKRCGENAYCDIIDGRETCQCLPEFNGDPAVKCVIKCNSHTDCPDTMSCFVDRQCRSPCVHSAHGCGINAKCKVEEHRPVCYCPTGWIGDETIQCFNQLQGSDQSFPSDQPSSLRNPSRPFTTSSAFGSSGIKCASNTDCPRNTTCIRSASGPGKECVDPCITRTCGRNANCLVDERRRSYCMCPVGYTGDARIDCSSISRNRESYFEPYIQADQARDPEYFTNAKPVQERVRYRRCSKPEICGLNAECRLDHNGNTQCLCMEGYMGQPPKCRPECRQNKECPANHVCVSDTRVGYPNCAKSCASKVCGAHADCIEFERGQEECVCPPGQFGDPLVKCETAEMRLGKDCATDYDCGIKLRCEIGEDERKCVDPCTKKYCASQLICDVQDHKAVCKCPPGMTGNEYVGCTRDVVLDQEYNLRCGNMSCGPNAECRIVDGTARCFCRSGYVGRAPYCIAECFSNADCPSDLTCDNRRCRHRCSGCGKNARCRVVPNLSRDSVCTCKDGFEGNPYSECVAVF